jgi:uncharacterized protein
MRQCDAGVAQSLPMKQSMNIEARVEAIEWARVSRDLDADGYATIQRLLTADECVELAALYR